MRSDLSDVPRAIELGKATMRNIKENLFWALFYNAVCIPVAAGVLYPAFGMKLSPMIGAAAMSFSSVFVVSNALRLRFFHGRAQKGGEDASAEDAIQARIGSIALPDEDREGEETMSKRINVEGMMCQHCVKHVHDALQNVPGVKSVDVSLEEKRALVECDGSVSDDALRAAVVDEGYEVTGIEG